MFFGGVGEDYSRLGLDLCNSFTPDIFDGERTSGEEMDGATVSEGTPKFDWSKTTPNGGSEGATS